MEVLFLLELGLLSFEALLGEVFVVKLGLWGGFVAVGLLLYLLEGFFILTYFLLFLLQLLILAIILILQLPYLPQFLIEAHFHLPLPLLIIPHQPILFLLL